MELRANVADKALHWTAQHERTATGAPRLRVEAPVQLVAGEAELTDDVRNVLVLLPCMAP
jgi:hypothetical protein